MAFVVRPEISHKRFKNFPIGIKPLKKCFSDIFLWFTSDFWASKKNLMRWFLFFRWFLTEKGLWMLNLFSKLWEVNTIGICPFKNYDYCPLKNGTVLWIIINQCFIILFPILMKLCKSFWKDNKPPAEYLCLLSDNIRVFSKKL